MSHSLKIKIKTLSNLFIGGSPRPFEIGGIDLWTAVDRQGYPCIPASSFKGALRTIIMEDSSALGERIGQWYADYLRQEKEMCFHQLEGMDAETLKRVERRYDEAIHGASAVYLFGIREFNNTPKLLFNDLRFSGPCLDKDSCFCVDTKTSVNTEGLEPKSNPRTYKAAAPGLEFVGEIEFYRFKNQYFDEHAEKTCREYLFDNLDKFNQGIYRLGNSKSRGYGKIQVTMVEES